VNLSARTLAAIEKGPQMADHEAANKMDGPATHAYKLCGAFATRIAQMAAEDAVREAAKMCDEQAALWLDSANASGALMGCKREILSPLEGGDRGEKE